MARRTNSPWSKTYKEGLSTSAVNDHVNIDQNVSATITTGVIDSVTGQWKGIIVSDEAFTIDAVHEAVPNGATVTSPQGASIDMTGFKTLQIAIKGSQAGNHTMTAAQGGDVYYANLTPPDGGATLRGNGDWYAAADFEDLTSSTNSLSANVWNIYTIINRLQDQKTLQFLLTNSTGSEEATLQFAYLRVA